MPWEVCDLMQLREEFVALASKSERNMAELCRRFGISRKTGYKWLQRASTGVSLASRSTRPRTSPTRTSEAMERAVLAVRLEHDTWGGRKIAAALARRGFSQVPAVSTVTEILRRHGRIDEAQATKHAPWHRFEHEHPNDLWQMDFKGHFGLANGSRCHPLTLLDDHSRFSLAVRACENEQTQTVQQALIEVFRRYGLPRRMLCDNGSPWGGISDHGLTPLTVWLLLLDVPVSHGRAFHPQTQGKEERFHRTLKLEVLRDQCFDDHAASQTAFDRFRHCYNHERPHEALAMAVPCERYQPSVRSYPETMPVVEYAPGVTVRKVQQNGWISYQGRACRLPDALVGQAVALEPTRHDGLLSVQLARHRLGLLDLRGEVPTFVAQQSDSTVQD